MTKTSLLRIAKSLTLPPEAVTEVLGWIGRRGQGKSYGAQKLADMRRKGRGSKPPTFFGEAHHTVTLSDSQVAELRALWATGKYQQRDLARRFGVSQSTVWRLAHRITRSTAP